MEFLSLLLKCIFSRWCQVSKQLIPVTTDHAMFTFRQRKNMHRRSSHKFKLMCVCPRLLYGNFGVEWHRDFNKDFTQIYCVVECRARAMVWMLHDWTFGKRTRRLHDKRVMLRCSHEGNACRATIQRWKTHIGLHRFFFIIFSCCRRQCGNACSTECSLNTKEIYGTN